jgi:hypothetical protein
MKTKQFNSFKFLSIGLSCSLLLTLSACGDGTDNVEETDTVETTLGSDDTMDDWDNNRFNESFTSTGRFGGWDENKDNMLDQNEYNRSYFDTWDVNNDDILDEDEWNNGTRDFGVGGENWKDWDSNKDSRLDENEFNSRFGNNTSYKDRDRDGDGMLNEREYSDGIFSSWDNDRDGSITNDEYNTRYNRYYGNDM